MAFTGPKLYDASKVSVTFRGYVIQGFAPGTFIEVERAVDAFQKQVGSGGDVARARQADRSGQATLTLMQTSPANDKLSLWAKEDEDLGTAVGPFMVKDFLGTTLCHCPNAWIRKLPVVGFGNELGNRVWVWDGDRFNIMAGGAL